MAEIILPRYDEEYDESSIIFWHKQEGDPVQKGDVLVEVQTEKAVSEIEAEEDGVLEKITVKRGEVATVGDVLGVIGAKATDTRSEEVSSTTEAAPKEPSERTFVRVAPRLRRLAKELQVDLTKVSGTGSGGNMTESDIRNAADGVEVEAAGEKISGIRKTIATRMKASLENSAQLTETAYADVTRLSLKRKSAVQNMSWNSWILFAATKAIQDHPYMNGTFKDDVWTQHEQVHLGIATDSEDGLYVPVVENAHEKSIEEIDQEVGALAQSVHDKNIAASKLSGSTFTVTNLGGFGVHFFTPIINPPELAILGLGKIESDVVLEAGEVRERLRLPLSLTFDHQIIDGAPAARFLQTLIAYLENPEKLT